MNHIRIGLGAVCALLILAGMPLAAQPPRLMRFLNTDDGVCSNHIYRILEDRRGFLWIATDNGISRYDGKDFTNFSVANGLPENEVLGMELEQDGTLWASCFNGTCAWYDAVHNRFVAPPLIPLSPESMRREYGGGIFTLTPLIHGGMLYANGGRGYIFLSRIMTGVIALSENRWFYRNPPDVFSMAFQFDSTRNYIIRLGLAGKTYDSITLASAITDARRFEFKEGRVQYIFYDKEPAICRYRIASVRPFSVAIDSVVLSHPSIRISFSTRSLAAIAADGRISVLDKATLHRRYTLVTGCKVNCAFEDSHGNLWAGTNDKGICLYQTPMVSSLPMPRRDADSNLLSLAKAADGSIIAGNYNGQLIHYTSGTGNKTRYDMPGAQWVRSIVVRGNKIFTFSDMASYCNGKPILSEEGYGMRGGKWAIAMNDTTLLVANLSGHGALYTVNTKTCKSSALHIATDRAQIVAQAADGNIYFTGLSGLFLFDIRSGEFRSVFPESKLLQGRITSIAAGPDSTLWVMSAGGGLVVLKHHKIAGRISPANGILSGITCLSVSGGGQLFAGARQGIYKITYRMMNERLSAYSLESFSVKDGLPANDIARILVAGDSVYATTGKGLAFFTKSLGAPSFQVESFLVGARINQQDVPLAGSYMLKSDENAITLAFAGVELSGHVRELQYRLDKDTERAYVPGNSYNPDTAWTPMPGNTLNLLLKSGKHFLETRAVNDAGHPGGKITGITIEVDTPLLQIVWFRMMLGMLGGGLILVYFYRRYMDRQRRAYIQQLRLDEERRRITADLHDDIGANLSSLQLYSAVAGKLIDTDPDKAKDMLQKIAEGSAAVQDNLGDIIWSMKPAGESFVSTTARIKNFVSDVLGAAGIDYSIALDPALDKASNITLRKNIILIIKEAVNNCAKYSKATSVRITAKTDNAYMLVEIADNGIGFDVAGAAHSGNGLDNMRKRSEELGGTCTQTSRPGEGTTIACRLPIIGFRDAGI